MSIPSIPIFMIVFVSTTIAIQIMLKRNDSGFEKSCKEYLDKEALAEKTIKRNFTDFPYIYPNKDILPYQEYPNEAKYEKVIRRQNLAYKKADLEMIHFPEPLSNADIKINYGKNNFDKLIVLEEHYNGYIRALYDWAKELFELDNIDDTITILEEAINLKAEISQVYTLLADCYFKNNNKDKLSLVYTKAKESNINVKEKTLNYIKKLINN